LTTDVYNREMTQSSKVDLVGVGLNATDTVFAVEQCPAPGAKVEFSSESVMAGGQVASTVVACQMWGMKTRYVGKLGDDDAARLHEREFARTGVEAKLIHVADAPSPKSVILVDREGERTVICRRDDRMTLHPDELKREWIVNARVLHIDGHDTAAATLAATWAREAGVPVTADIDDMYPGIEKLLENVDYLIMNKDFPTRLTGESDLRRALQKTQARYGCKLAASTLGPDGVLAWDGKEFFFRPAFHVTVADTTGAGDIFRAGFIYGLLQGWELERQLDFASAAGAINCTGRGARGRIETVDAIEAFVETAPRYASADAAMLVAG
jgi:sulfofructose kinase